MKIIKILSLTLVLSMLTVSSAFASSEPIETEVAEKQEII